MKTMKKDTRKVLLASLVLGAVAITTAYGMNKVSAAEENGNYPPLVQKIAERFNLNENEVKTVFDEQRVTRQAEMKQRQEERLNQLVKDGKITNEQKDLLMKKREELREKFGKNGDNWRTMSREDKQKVRKSHREEMHQWSEENGIDLRDLRPQQNENGRGAGRGGNNHKF